MSKDGTNRGGSRPGAGRKPKALTEKLANGNPGGRKLTTVDFGSDAADLQGAEMPPVKDYLKAKQKDGSVTCAEDIFKETWEWLHERKCDQLIPTQQIEQYAMSVARWIQCEEAVSEYHELRKTRYFDGRYIWNPKFKDDGYDTLFGHRVFVSNYMSEIVPGSKPVLFGDFSYFWIGDRGKRNIKRLNEAYESYGRGRPCCCRRRVVCRTS